MDAPGGARDSRFNLGYNMGLLSGESPPEIYGNPNVSLGRPPSTLGQQMSRSTMLQSGCGGLARGLKRSGSDQCFDDRPMGSQSLGLDQCLVPEMVDDGYTSLQPKKSPPSNGKKTKGRVKIKMEYIDNKLRRYTTFSKRKTGIMKKAYELSTLTGTQVMLLVASETGHVYTFATRKLQPMITSDSGKRLIQTCLNSPDPPSGAPVGDQRMSATGFEETELTYNIADDDVKVRQAAAAAYGEPPSAYAQQLDHHHAAAQQYHAAAAAAQHAACPSPLPLGALAQYPHSHAHHAHSPAPHHHHHAALSHHPHHAHPHMAHHSQR